MMKIINATPHDVNIVGENGQVVRTYAASGICPRCSVNREAVDEIDGIRINRTVFGDVVGLPEYVEGTYYIVSVLVANAAKDRKDLLITDDAVRDDKGRIIGCKALAVV